jgi:hypothetical protein
MSVHQIRTKPKPASPSPAPESFKIEDPEIEDPEAVKAIVEAAEKTPGATAFEVPIEPYPDGLPAAFAKSEEVRSAYALYGLTYKAGSTSYEPLGSYSVDDGDVLVACDYDRSRQSRPRLSAIREIHLREGTLLKIRMILLPTPYAGAPSRQLSSIVEGKPRSLP